MIISSEFENDNNKLLKDIQHDMYGHTLWKIFVACRRAMIKAEAILDVRHVDTDKAREISSFDHRGLQAAHDIIASVYRYKSDDGGQLRLAESIEDQKNRYIRGWANWLDQELDDLTGIPKFAHSVIEVVVHDKTDKGYQAEEVLADILLRYYSAESWMRPDGYLKGYPAK